MASTGRERPYRGRGRLRPAPKNDAATSALTAQVILCAIMIVCVLLMKKFDLPRYAAFKSQYSVMLSESSESLGGLFSRLAGPEGIFSEIWEKAGDMIEGFLSAKPAPQSEEDPGGVELDEPEDRPGMEDSGGDLGQPDFSPSYDYLGGQAVSYVTASPVTGFLLSEPSIKDFEAGGSLRSKLGNAVTKQPHGGFVTNASGGMFPVAAVDTGKMTPAPAGCVLSPVYLSSKIKPPVTGLITSGFSYRYHPVTGKNDFHTGLDIAAEEGSPILAALPGEVAEVGRNDIYGNYIVLKHATNLQTSYSHCSEIIAKTGMSVRQGERIALVGQTGTTTGPHLHFSVIVEGQYTDPAWVLNDYIKLIE